jgi:hypothetical protein
MKLQRKDMKDCKDSNDDLRSAFAKASADKLAIDD